MSTIRCDNAECVVYVDELARRRPEQFELEVDTRPLCAVPHRVPSEVARAARAVLDPGAGAGVGSGAGGLAGRLASALVGAASGGRPAGARGRRGPCSS